MMKLSSKKIAEVVGSVSNVLDEEITNISTDSRSVFKGDLFIAIKGEKFDGHDFVKDVVDKGASVVIVERLIPAVPAVRQILVENCLDAYGAIGAYVRLQYKGVVIGLTGSSGKTTSKEELKFVLKKFAPVSATEGNFNNHVGVPRSLCNLDMSSSYAIIEMGMSTAGEMSYLTSLVKPNIAVVINVYPMHIEFFPNDGIEGIAKAKAEIFGGLDRNGIAIINDDTAKADILREKARDRTPNLILYGKDNLVSKLETPDGWKLEARFGNEVVSYELTSRGDHVVYNSLCVLSVASVLGLDLKQAADYLKDFETPAGRGRHYQLKLPNGGESYTLIDDSYSGQPDAMIIAIKALGGMKAEGKKIALLGKMGELGAHTQERHMDVGKALNETDIKVVIGVGEPAKDILAQLEADKEQYYFDTKDGAEELLLNKVLQNGDILLIKGSHYGSQLFKVAEKLIGFKG